MRIPRLALATMFAVSAPILSFAATPPATHGHSAGRMITAEVCRPDRGAFGTYVEAPPQEYGLATPLICTEAELSPGGLFSQPPVAPRAGVRPHRTAALTLGRPLRAQY